MSQFLKYALLVAYVEARFGQEQVPVAAIQALGDFGNPGDAGTLSGQVPGVLLAAASPCDKLSLADEIVDTLGNDPAVIEAAAGLVAAEQNFNPFAVDIPSLCADATLPATEELRGIIPLVDPDVDGADAQNANSAQSLTQPFDAAGLSVAEVTAAQGFSAFTAVDGAGGNVDVGGADAGADAGADTGNADAEDDAAACNAGQADQNAGQDQAQDDQAENENAADNQNNQDNQDNQDNQAQDGQDQNADAGAETGADAGADAGAGAAGADFGQCTPTIDFQLGREGRKADEGTFLPTDPLVAEGQQDALNPNIITNRVCDQLVNVCEANNAAVAACEDAQALVEQLGTKDATTADAFNQALGF